jgi:cytochrome c
MSVTPKGHVALVHACEQMEVVGGVSRGREDRVEVWHQFGKATDARTRNRRKSEQRFLPMSRWEQMNRNPLIAKHKETITGEFALSDESTLLKCKKCHQ